MFHVKYFLNKIFKMKFLFLFHCGSKLMYTVTIALYCGQIDGTIRKSPITFKERLRKIQIGTSLKTRSKNKHPQLEI